MFTISRWKQRYEEDGLLGPDCTSPAPSLQVAHAHAAGGFGLLSNNEVLELDQNLLGKQAHHIEVDSGEVLVKELEGGDFDVGLFNPGPKESRVSVRWSELGIRGKQRVRDLRRQQNLGILDDHFPATVASHGVVLVRLSAASS